MDEGHIYCFFVEFGADGWVDIFGVCPAEKYATLGIAYNVLHHIREPGHNLVVFINVWVLLLEIVDGLLSLVALTAGVLQIGVHVGRM